MEHKLARTECPVRAGAMIRTDGTEKLLSMGVPLGSTKKQLPTDASVREVIAGASRLDAEVSALGTRSTCNQGLPFPHTPFFLSKSEPCLALLPVSRVRSMPASASSPQHWRTVQMSVPILILPHPFSSLFPPLPSSLLLPPLPCYLLPPPSTLPSLDPPISSLLLSPPGTLNPRPWTLDPQPYTRDPPPYTLDQRLSTIQPRPWTLDPRPETGDQRPSKLVPRP
eukprot:3308353-Rhodomonas_salina.1